MTEPVEDRPVYAKTTRSDTAYSIHVSSTPNGRSMTVWQLRDFLRAIDAAGIPDEATLSAEHNWDTKAFTGLRVAHTFVVEEAPGD